MDNFPNMTDPQAMAAAWMTQFTDPTNWQGNPMAKAMQEAGVHMNQGALEKIRDDYLLKAGALWQDFLAAKTPELKDRRFSAREWTTNPLAAYQAASYLLNAEALMRMA